MLRRNCITVLTMIVALATVINAQSATRVDPASIPRGSFSIDAELPVSDIDRGLLSGLSADDRTAFAAAGELVYRHDGDFVPALLPGTGSARQRLAASISEDHREHGNNYALEVLMALDLPPDLAGELPGADIDLHIYNVLHRISTLAGLEYFSASRGRMREFYLTSSVVAADGTGTLPDPRFTDLRDEYRFVIRQEDASFGNNTYEVVTTPESISIRNISPMTYNFIRIADPGDLELQMRVIRDGDRLLFYAFSSLRAPRIFGIRNKLSNSFYNRITALYTWFADQLVLIEI
jgi:hypothetical protein